MGKVAVEIRCPTCGGAVHIDVVKGKDGLKDYTGECKHCDNRVTGKFNGKGFENIVAETPVPKDIMWI